MKKISFFLIMIIAFLYITLPIAYGVNLQNEETQVINNGIYKIKTNVGSDKYIDISAGSTENGANTQIWDNSDVEQQEFQITYLDNGYYTIQAKHSGKVLDVESAGKANGTNVWQYENNGTEAQQWKIEKTTNGKYKIISRCNNLCLDVAGANTNNGTNIQVYEWNGSNAQLFDFEEVEEHILEPEEQTDKINNGIYKIKTNVGSDKYIDISAGSTENGANTQIWDNSDVEQQEFQITYLDNGYYTIQAKHSGKVLDVESAGKANGTNVWQYENNRTEAQQWKIEKTTNGKYKIISRCNNLCLDVAGANTNNGTNIQVYEWNGSNAQLFDFEEVEEHILEPEEQTDKINEQEEAEQEENIIPEDILPDGLYKIKTNVDKNKCLDITDVSNENGANVQIWDSTKGINQKFQITYLDNGYYTIQAKHSGKVLDVESAGKANGTNVWQYENNGTEAQQWKIEKTTNGKYKIISRCNNLCLDVAGANTNNGTNIQVYEWNGSDAQLFDFEETEVQAIETGVYEIQMTKDTSRVLEVSNGSTENEANVRIGIKQDKNYQKFYIEYDESNKNYKIIAIHSSKALDVCEGKAESGTNVWQYDDNNTIAQRWKIKETEDSNYCIISECGNGDLVLDVNGGRADNGANVQIYTSNNTIAQKFKIVATNIEESSFLGLDEQRYPGYKESLARVQAQHPNWKINIKYTGIDWNTAVEAENQKDGNIPYSKTDRTGAWRHATDTAEYSSGWYRASSEAIAYMMDPRNSLDDEYIFQFQDLTSNSGSYNNILGMISCTFLTRYEQWNTSEIISAILSAAKLNNVSPFHITSRILQEQGVNGNSLNGYNYEGRIVYNLFNINDIAGTDAGTIYGRARRADREKWYSPITCIMGSTHFLRSNYFDRGQITLYYQKYNVVSQPLFQHQYMQNIRAANDEGYRIAKSYKSNGLIDSEFTFEIPVYENMPSSPCSRPRT